MEFAKILDKENDYTQITWATVYTWEEYSEHV